jgi:hypothetical protein
MAVVRNTVISRRIAAAAAAGAFAATGIGYALATPPTPPKPASQSPAERPAAPSTAPAAPAPAPAGPSVRPVTAAELGDTWRPGCPVGPEGLRLIELDYLGVDGQTHRGNLVVNADAVDDVIAIFDDLRWLGYPVEKMQTVDHYPGADDELSMRDNNTSAFNCRPLPGSTAWSLHAYGRAVDVNPLINPYLDKAGDLQPKTAGRYLDRTLADPALLKAGDPAVRAFTDRGWRWGGAWRDPVDYQHFEIG